MWFRAILYMANSVIIIVARYRMKVLAAAVCGVASQRARQGNIWLALIHFLSVYLPFSLSLSLFLAPCLSESLFAFPT